MSMFRTVIACLLMLGGLYAHPARAAQSYDACVGFIDSLPATISTQGVWCLRHDLSTAVTSGNAITIAANNVTIDCNDFKVGGLGAGSSSQTKGIYAYDRQNASVRHCNIRGFQVGILLAGGGGAGHKVEDNRLDNNLVTGIEVDGTNNRVKGNQVYDTGGFPSSGSSFAIRAAAEVLDNTVVGIFGTATHNFVYGIIGNGDSTRVERNSVSGLIPSGAGSAVGIQANGNSMVVADNRIMGTAATVGYGITAYYAANTVCTGNAVIRFTTTYDSCDVLANNSSLP